MQAEERGGEKPARDRAVEQRILRGVRQDVGHQSPSAVVACASVWLGFDGTASSGAFWSARSGADARLAARRLAFTSTPWPYRSFNTAATCSASSMRPPR